MLTLFAWAAALLLTCSPTDLVILIGATKAPVGRDLASVMYFFITYEGKCFIFASCWVLAEYYPQIPGWGPGTVSAAPRPSSSTCRCTRRSGRTSGGVVRSRSGRRAPRPSMRPRDPPIPAMHKANLLWIYSPPLRLELLIMHAGYEGQKAISWVRVFFQGGGEDRKTLVRMKCTLVALLGVNSTQCHTS